MDAARLIAAVTKWSQRDPRVIAAGLCGSYARGDAGPDSDVDFCILTPDPGALLDDQSWIYGLGAGASITGAIEDYNLVQSVRVFYGATEAEFGITDQSWAEVPVDAETASVINDGLRPLYDPERRLEKAIAFASSTKA